MGTTSVYAYPMSVGRTFPLSSLFLPPSSTIGHMDDSFGTRLQIARKRAGIRTQEALGDLVGVSGKTIRNYETNKTRPDSVTLEALREVVGIFDAAGDPVEVAVRASRLTEDRQYGVIGYYKRQLREQDDELERRGSA